MDLDKIARRISSSGRIRTAGRIEFVRDQGPLRRDLRAKGFSFSSDTLKDLAKVLWAAERAHSYGMAALRLFSKTPASEISPDGLLGGRGYIQQIKEMRSNLSQAVEVLSAFSDTMHDEVNADHWAGASESEPEIEEIVEQADAVKAAPEQYVEEQFEQQVPEASEDFNQLTNPSPEEMNPVVENSGPPDWDWGQEETQIQSSEKAIHRPKDPKDSDLRVLKGQISSSSIPVETLPGPRVKHIGPGEGDQEFGYYADDDERPSDDPIGEGFRFLEEVYQDWDIGKGGVTGYDNPTDGDTSKFKQSALKLANYSWLPGSRNEKLMPYYDPNATDEDVEWMRAHDQPEPPKSLAPPPENMLPDKLWEARRNADISSD
jgi:hypothetical protein